MFEMRYVLSELFAMYPDKSIFDKLLFKFGEKIDGFSLFLFSFGARKACQMLRNLPKQSFELQNTIYELLKILSRIVFTL
jgi:hypothetical protein